MPCQACFGVGIPVERALVNLPQPRWIGPTYQDSKPRTVVLALNPGAGNTSHAQGNAQLVTLLRGFRDGSATFDDVLAYQAHHMPAWGKTPGRFISFYTEATGKGLSELAFLNVALCATVGNCYPPAVLDTCFERHTAGLLQALAPDIVLLSGSAVHKYVRHIGTLLPAARLEPMLHYAHREGQEREQQEFVRIREFLTRMSSASGA